MQRYNVVTPTSELSAARDLLKDGCNLKHASGGLETRVIGCFPTALAQVRACMARTHLRGIGCCRPTRYSRTYRIPVAGNCISQPEIFILHDININKQSSALQYIHHRKSQQIICTISDMHALLSLLTQSLPSMSWPVNSFPSKHLMLHFTPVSAAPWYRPKCRHNAGGLSLSKASAVVQVSVQPCCGRRRLDSAGLKLQGWNWRE